MLNELSRRLRGHFSSSALYLYGSRAKGTSAPDSDYDLFLFVPENELSRLPHLSKALQPAFTDFKKINKKEVSALRGAVVDTIAIYGHSNRIPVNIHIMPAERLASHFSPLRTRNRILRVRQTDAPAIRKGFKISTTGGEVVEIERAVILHPLGFVLDSPTVWKVNGRFTVPIFVNKLLTSKKVHDQLNIEKTVKEKCFYATAKALCYAEPKLYRSPTQAVARLFSVLRIASSQIDTRLRDEIAERFRRNVIRAKKCRLSLID